MPPNPLSTLESTIRDLISAYPGRCTLALTDVHTGDHFGIDEHAEMPSESVIKVLVLAALYRSQSEGRLTLDDRIATEDRHRIFGTGVLQHLSPGIDMSVRDAAVLMIIISDNPAFELCLDVLGGIDYVNDTAATLGMTETRMKRRLTDRSTDPDGRSFVATTAADFCLLMQNIARGEVVSPDASADMLAILKLQQSRDKLTRDLPWIEFGFIPPGPHENWIASKDGINMYRGVRNDAAIFHRGNHEVAVAAFTELGETGVPGEHPGNALLARIGLAIWNWMGETL
jgi:beta-lactamase class A